jgi:hypothetical protein
MFNFFLLFYTQNNPLSFTLLSTRRTTYIVYIPHLLYTLCPSLQSLAISSTCVSFHYFRFGTADVSCKLLLLKKTYFKTESSFPPSLFLPSYSTLATEEVNSRLDKKLCFVENRHSLED